MTATLNDPRLPARFWAKVALGPAPEERPDLGPCWIWTGAVNVRSGYAQFFIMDKGRDRVIRGHRHAYLTLVGPTPLGLDHLCRVRRCVNPAHLEPASQAENLRRSPIAVATINASKTHCQQGHPLYGDNLYLYPNGSRDCRVCRRERLRRSAARKAAAARAAA